MFPNEDNDEKDDEDENMRKLRLVLVPITAGRVMLLHCLPHGRLRNELLVETLMAH